MHDFYHSSKFSALWQKTSWKKNAGISNYGKNSVDRSSNCQEYYYPMYCLEINLLSMHKKCTLKILKGYKIKDVLFFFWANFYSF